MRHRLVVVAFVALAMALALSGWHPARAQEDGLSDEQLALLERIFAAREQLDLFESYVEEGTGSEAQELSVVLGEQSLDLLEAVEWERAQTVINAPERKNVDAQLSSAVTSQGEEVFRVLAEARLVDDTLYVSAAYSEPSEDLPPLPDGWIVLDEESAETIGEQYPAIGALEFGSITSGEASTLLEDQERIRQTASDVTLETITLEDGTEADQITVVFGRDALLGVMTEDTDDPFQLGLFSGLTDDSAATLTLVLDGEGRALEVRTRMDLIAVDIDAAALSPEDFPPGALLSFTFQGVEDQRYEQINEAFEPVSAPEDLAPTPAS